MMRPHVQHNMHASTWTLRLYNMHNMYVHMAVCVCTDIYPEQLIGAKQRVRGGAAGGSLHRPDQLSYTGRRPVWSRRDTIYVNSCRTFI